MVHEFPRIFTNLVRDLFLKLKKVMIISKYYLEKKEGIGQQLRVLCVLRGFIFLFFLRANPCKSVDPLSASMASWREVLFTES